ncbi:MAG: hypothetical protein AAF485_24975, partial [Chloroflexota bacterium]
MSNQREDFLNNIRQNLQKAVTPGSEPEHPGSFEGYTFQADKPIDDLVKQFSAELKALDGQAHFAETVDDVVEIIQSILETQG